MCGACRKTGECRLGLDTERLDSDGAAHFEVVCPESYEGGPGVAHGGWTAGCLDEVISHATLVLAGSSRVVIATGIARVHARAAWRELAPALTTLG